MFNLWYILTGSLSHNQPLSNIHTGCLVYVLKMLLLIAELNLLIRVTGVMRESCSFVYASIFQRRLTGQMVSGRDLNEMLIHVWCHQSKSKGGGEPLLHWECTVAWNTQRYAPSTHPCSLQPSTVLLTYHLHIYLRSWMKCFWNIERVCACLRKTKDSNDYFTA